MYFTKFINLWLAGPPPPLPPSTEEENPALDEKDGVVELGREESFQRMKSGCAPSHVYDSFLAESLKSSSVALAWFKKPSSFLFNLPSVDRTLLDMIIERERTEAHYDKKRYFLRLRLQKLLRAIALRKGTKPPKTILPPEGRSVEEPSPSFWSHRGIVRLPHQGDLDRLFLTLYEEHHPYLFAAHWSDERKEVLHPHVIDLAA